jgi:hypothetical protein
LSERRIVQVGLQVTEVRAIESIKDVSLKLQLEFLCEPKSPAQRKIPRLSTRSQDRTYSTGTSARIGRRGKSGTINPIVWTTFTVREKRIATEAIGTPVSLCITCCGCCWRH